MRPQRHLLQRVAGLTACWLAAACSSGATNYYVSTSGGDGNAGTSTSAAWRTINRVNNNTFRQGDAIFFEGGQSFTGRVYFDANDAGAATNPIVVSSYGAGRASILSGAEKALDAYNCGGYLVSNLLFAGSGRTSNGTDGISFYNDLGGDMLLQYVYVDDVEVSGYGKWGIAIGAWNGRSGYRDVRITKAVVHDNGKGGIITWGPDLDIHQDVYIGHCAAYNNPGITGLTENSGHGIVIGNASTGMIERCVAYSNGWLCDWSAGPVGIWAYDSEHVTIQHNESYDNRTGGGVDGGGFDFDQNVRHSVMQYNYAHGNDGPGYLFAHGVANFNFSNNVVRYNISENDGRANKRCAIMVWGRALDCEIHNNTVFMDDPGGTARGAYVFNDGVTALDADRLHFRNNIFQTTNGVRLVEVTPSQIDGSGEILFQGNDYFTSGNGFQILWNATTYTNLADWRAATTQELVGVEEAGSSVDPKLTDPGGGGTLADADLLETLEAYELRLDSALIDAGLDLSALFGVDPGSQDYFGNPLPQGEAHDIGAHEALYDSDADDLADTWEWAHFGTLATNATDDGDIDGADNYHEFVAGTQPTNGSSAFVVHGLTNAAAGTNFSVTVATEAGRHYTIFFTDDRLSNGVPWSGFADTNAGVGTWTETSTVSATHTFLDDFSTNTTSGEPATGGRCYRVKVEKP